MPSKLVKFFEKSYYFFYGRNVNLKLHTVVIGKAGINRNLGKNSIVRGVAKNPVDHPNGGRTKSCKPERSPWGWVAKLNK